MSRVTPRVRVDLRVILPEADAVEVTGIDADLALAGYDVPELLGDPEAILIQGIEPLTLTWERRPPGVADDFSVVIEADNLPIDPRIARAIQVSLWAWIEVEPGDELLDYVVGAPDDNDQLSEVVARTAGTARTFTLTGARDAGPTITLDCQDLTIVPSRHYPDDETRKGLDLGRPLVGVVEQLIGAMPAGDRWSVRTVAGLGGAVNLRELRVGGEAAQSALSLVEDGAAQALEVLQAAVELQVPVDDLTVAQLEPGVDGVSEALGSQLEPGKFSALNVRDVKWGTVFGTRRVSTWQAITQLCSMSGVVPEVTLDASGQPMVLLLTVEQYLDGRAFRPFHRGRIGDGPSRRRIDLSDVPSYEVVRDYEGGRKVDFVDVVGLSADRGEAIRKRYGGADGDATANGRGLFISAPGITDEAQLERIAKATYRSVTRGEFSLRVDLERPWSVGGDVTDPDLIYVAPGSTVVLQFADALEQQGDPAQLLRQRGLPETAARRIVAATRRLQPSLVMQVIGVVHTFELSGDGAWSGALLVQDFLDDGTRPQVLDAEDLLAPSLDSIGELATRVGLPNLALPTLPTLPGWLS